MSIDEMLLEITLLEHKLKQDTSFELTMALMSLKNSVINKLLEERLSYVKEDRLFWLISDVS